MSTPNTPYATTPIFYDSEEETGYIPHGLPLCVPCFSPLQGTSEAWSPFQPAQVVPYNLITETPPSDQPEPEVWSPSPAQPEQDMDDYKFPPQVLEHLDNSQISVGSGVYYDPAPSAQFRYRQMEHTIKKSFSSERSELKHMVKDLHKEKLEQEKKQKDKELLIEELQRTVKMLEKKVTIELILQQPQLN